MLASQLIDNGFPSLDLFDKAGFALQLMDEYDIQHLPVRSEEKLVGLVAKDDLLDTDEDSPVAAVQDAFLSVSVKGEEFFLSALRKIAEQELSVLPVVNEQTELIGIISSRALLKKISLFIGNEEKGGVIVLQTEKRNFSFGEVNRLVETNDAYITQVNTYTEADTGWVIITIRVNKTEISDIVATFQRYDYIVRYYFGEESYANELRENYQHLLSYLNI
jgi:acetoin utilization protein AcuB